MEARYQDVMREFAASFAAPTSLPEYIATMDENYDNQLAVQIMADMTDHGPISTMITNMHWGVRRIDGGRRFLTSDRPVRLEFPLRSDNAFLTLPIGPDRIFVAARSTSGLNKLLHADPQIFVERNNRKVVRQARQFAFAADDCEREWVCKNLAREPQAGFLDFIEGSAIARR
jgi:hypothetical protein